ncbi:MAG: hypothetical protein ACPGVJ_11200, partial [Mangrovicoccus sp.]
TDDSGIDGNGSGIVQRFVGSAMTGVQTFDAWALGSVSEAALNAGFHRLDADGCVELVWQVAKSLDGAVLSLDGVINEGTALLTTGLNQADGPDQFVLGLDVEGNGTGQVSLNGSQILVGGVYIGDLAVSGLSLDVTFNAAADRAAVNAVLEALALRSDSNDPPQSLSFTLELIYADGSKTSHATSTLTITREADRQIEEVLGATLVNSYTTGTQDEPRIAVLSDGSWVVVWVDDSQDGSGDGVYAQRFEAGGAPLGLAMQLATSSAGAQTSARVAALDNGDFVVIYGDGANLKYRVYDASFGSLLPEMQANSTDDTAAIDYLDAGVAKTTAGFSIVWAENTGLDGSGKSAVIRRFMADGTPMDPTESLVNGLATQGDQEARDLVGRQSGGEAVVYVDNQAN